MNRLALRFSLGILLAILVAFTVAVVIVRNSVDRQILTQRPPGADLLMATLARELASVPEEERAAWLDRLEEEAEMPARLVERGDLELTPATAEEISAGEPSMIRAEHGYMALGPLGDGSVLVVGPTPTRMHPTSRDFGLILLVLLGVVGVTGLALAGPVVRRVRDLERAANELGEGDLDSRAPAREGGDSVDSLARRFNAMASRLQGLLRNQQQLVQAVAHEIRTPITRLRFGLEMAAMDGSESERKRRLDAVHQDLEEMEALVEELLVFSRYDVGSTPRLQAVPIEATVERQIARLPSLSPELEIRVRPEEGAPGEAYADARAFNRVVGNLLSNACRYAKCRVCVAWDMRDGHLELTVTDDGPGVPPERREDVFEPFARLDQSRARQSGGVGLGLAIVARILQTHHGTAHVEEAPGGGARFVTRWPQR